MTGAGPVSVFERTWQRVRSANVLSPPWMLPGIAGLAALSIGGYLFLSISVLRLGFPLDDAWIHQVYARNLAWRGEWAFLPGSPSAGSTAPWWSAALAIGYALRLNPLFWAFFLGWLSLVGMGLIGVQAARVLAAGWVWRSIWLAGLLVTEWHLVWAAGSGMETLPYALILTFVLVSIARERPPWLALGVLTGASAWLRPDGVALLGPILLTWALSPGRLRGRGREALGIVAGFALLFVPYLIFNRVLAGDWWPNTFYAKQAEYAIRREVPFWLRYLGQLQLPLIGVGALLLPGAIRFLYRAWSARRWGVLAGLAWWLGYLGLYAWRLPVTYQHGRYLIPAMPIYLIWGLLGLMEWVREPRETIGGRVLSRAWTLSVGLVLFVFWVMGAQAYARDVAFIESELVAVARWIEAHTEPEARIAVHDIGAIGYFTDRDLVDLAGLVSPEVIPFIRDEARLEQYLDEVQADYLVSFPGWYPHLVREARLVYQTDGRFAPVIGGENVAVYRWPSPEGP